MLGITVLGSGSSGNAMVVHGRDRDILIDAGFSLRELRRRMVLAGIDESRIAAILVSHEHGDHSLGVGVAARNLGLPVYCTAQTARALSDRKRLGENLNLFAAGCAFDLGEFRVEPFSTPHDAIDPVGFTLSSEAGRIGVVTDLGHPTALVCHHLDACDILILECNHDLPMLHGCNRPWRLKQRIMGRHGHLSNNDSMALLRRVLHARTRHLVLAHTSQECNTYELVEKMVGQHLADMGREDVRYQVAMQETNLSTIWL